MSLAERDCTGAGLVLFSALLFAAALAVFARAALQSRWETRDADVA